jgi:hypothetical protein
MDALFSSHMTKASKKFAAFFVNHLKKEEKKNDFHQTES